MARQSEQLEREAEQTRRQLAGWLEELRSRVTPGQVIDQLADFAREGAAADFLRERAEVADHLDDAEEARHVQATPAESGIKA